MADMMSYINTGWVKVMRSIINSRSYDVPNALAAYCHCLMRANIKPGKVKGVFLKRGQFITGNDSFALECGLSPKQMRIALDMLEDDGLITREPIASRANNGADNRANKSKKSGTLITVVNYDFEDIPVISGYVNQGEQQGEQLVSDEGGQQGNSIRNRIRKTPQTPQGDNGGDMFKKFWDEYPKQVAEEEARKAFFDLDPSEDLLKIMIEALGKAKSSAQWQREDGRYIPKPSNWISGKRWKDEITEAEDPLLPKDHEFMGW